MADWSAAGARYYSIGFFYRQRFGGPVRKISLDAGLSCPNRDGTLGADGCIFCDPASFSPSRRLAGLSISQQIAHGIEAASAGGRVNRFVAYFQPGTNTYASVDRLRAIYEEALSYPQIVGVAIGTRPDCLPPSVLDLLAELSQRTFLVLEIGLQSIHQRSLQWLGRGHDYHCFCRAVEEANHRGLNVGAHVILGLPEESAEHVCATARELTRLGVHSVKLHNLYAVRGTRLAELLAAGQVRLPTMAEYVQLAADFLEWLSPRCVVERLSGDAPRQYLVAPEWCLDKSAVRLAIEAELQRRHSRQGAKLSTSASV